MPDLAFSHDRQFPTTHITDDLVLVVPDHFTDAESVLRVRDAIGAGGKLPEVIPQNDFIDELYQDTHIITCGHLANNMIIERLYTLRNSFIDTFFPGPNGCFVKSISDPMGFGKNIITVGASTDEDLHLALAVFEKTIEVQQGNLTRIHEHRFSHELPPFPDESDLESMIQRELDIWGGGWMASPFRGGALQSYLWHYYLTNHDVWGRAIPPVFAGSLEPWLAEREASPESYHCFFGLHHFIYLWDLIEDSPLYTNEDRRDVVTMFGELLEHLGGLFYLTPEANPPGEPRQNHSTFIGIDLAFGNDYMVKRYGIEAFEHTVEPVERIFSGQADSYKPNDDAGVGYAWLVPYETLSYLLYKNDYSYLDNGHIDDLCKLAVITTDNMRSEGGYGDTAGYAAFSPDGWNRRLWPLIVSAWRTPNAERLWALNWLGEGKRPTLSEVLSGLYGAVRFGENEFQVEGHTPEPPDDLLGICAMPLPESTLRWVRNHTPESHHPDDDRTYCDKISLRTSFDPDDEYLLLEGIGTLCHGHEDTNAIVRLSWNNRAWLADGDYIRAAPKFHNSVTVTRDGVGVLESTGDGLLIPPLASENLLIDEDAIGLLQTEASGYNGVDWKRNIIWGKGRFIIVMDQLQCNKPGQYDLRCLWRLVGEVGQDDSTIRLHQQDESFFIRNVDGSDQSVIPDHYEGGYWTAYPYANAMIHELHQVARTGLDEGSEYVFINMLTPHEDIRIERLNNGLVKVTDGDSITITGVGNTTIGTVHIESDLFALTCANEVITPYGIEQIGTGSGEEVSWEGYLEDTEVLEDKAISRHLKTMMKILGHKPVLNRTLPIEFHAGGFQPVWQCTLDETEISAVDAFADMITVGSSEGRILMLSAEDGSERWQQPHDSTPTVLRIAALDGYESPAIIAGTADSTLMVMDSVDGSERWRQQLRNISNRGETVTDITIANLEGDGRTSVLAGTAGWFVNAFSSTGDPIWANWFRYHPITNLQVADVDGDGKAEVMVGTVYFTPLTVHNYDGSFRWSTLEQVGSEGNATTPRRGINMTKMCLVDLDLDGIREIIYGTADGWVFAVKPQDGAEVWHLNIVGEVTGLLVNRGKLIIASEYGDVYGMGFDGDILWRHHIADRIQDLVAVGDNELGVVCNFKRLTRIDQGGLVAGSHTFDFEIRHIHPCPDGVVYCLDGGHIGRLVTS